ncbi:MBL fold metallo-hydrolase [Chryseosolibacter indicus]|nr:MBL fold metallo-hydrolase [Chryseosolibacter indicus]
MQQSSFGKLPSGERLSRIKESKNYKDGKFQNLAVTSTIAEDASYIKLFIKFFGKGIGREPERPLPSIRTDLKKNTNGIPSVIWFGHSTYLLEVNDKRILVDPIFSNRPSPVQYAGSKSYPGTRIYNEADLPELDVIVISHDHYDHLDYNTISNLKEKAKLFCVPLGVGAHLEEWGVDKRKITELDWWEGITIADGFSLVATPARHFSGRGFSRDKTLWASYVLRVDQHNIFIGGDSGYDEVFKVIGEKYGPFDIAMLECGQYDKQWPNIHMMPEQTVQASIDLKARVLMPVHWGKFTLALHPWKEPIQRAKREAERLNVKVTTPLLGERVAFAAVDSAATEWWKEY